MSINKFLLSMFISHGFFDVIAMYPDIKYNLALYNTSIILLSLFSLYQTTLSLILFIFSSMYHFGKDFEYLFDESTYWAGPIMFSYSIIFNIDTWDDTLNWIGVDDNNLIIGSILLMSIQSIIATNNLYALITSIIIGLFGPYPGIFYYATIIHAPLGMYRYSINFEPLYKCIIYTLWIISSSIIYYTLDNNLDYINKYITPFNFKISMGIVMTHIITISIWQNINYNNLYKCLV